MPIQVLDYRTDVGNVVITPEIRSRFLRMEPGQVAQRHSHDLGHEVFLILEGQCEFEIEGERAVLGPGQMCFARRDEMHQVRVVGDQPMTMYLSVTPHVEPTHTFWEGDRKLPPRYGGATARERPVDADPTPIEALADRHAAAAQQLAQVAAAGAIAQAGAIDGLKRAAAAGDRAAVKAAADAIWQHVYATHRALEAVDLAWNDLAPRTMP